MLTKLPRWILWGGAVLAFSAGCVNTAALMEFTNLSVSHVTGNVSLFSAAVAHFDAHSILYISASLLSFLAGAILSGFVIGQKSLKLGRSYGGAVIRTTHLTGLTSDVGAAIGNWLAGRPISKPALGF